MMTRTWIIPLCLLLAVLPMAGCQTSDNPAEGGFVGGLNGLFSGSYDRRLSTKQTQLSGARLEEQYLATNNARLGNEAGMAASQRARLHQQVQVLQARTRELEARNNQMQTDTEAKRQEHADFDKRLRQVRIDLDLGRDVDASRKSAETAERERRALEAELQDLTVVANARR